MGTAGEAAPHRLAEREVPRQSARGPIGRARPLHQEVVERLRDMIVEGDLAVGDRLHEANLAEQLQVSRTPVREAVKLLATEGLVELLPRRGARVAGLSEKALTELFEVIAGIERHAAELAAARMTPRELARIDRLHQRMRGHFAEGDRPRYFQLNQEIHLLVVAAAKNATLAALHGTLLAKARPARYVALAEGERWAEAMGEHDALMQALAAHAVERAGQIMAAHVKGTGDALLTLLRRQAGP